MMNKKTIDDLESRVLHIGEVNIEELYYKCININSLLNDLDELYVFNTICFTWGGSEILDYALIQALIKKYKLKNYLEIGTYTGESLCVAADVAEQCYSIAVLENHPAHMKKWCASRHLKDYSNLLVDRDNMVQYLEDSYYFDYSKVTEKIDLYFVDGDHSYRGVFIDSIKIFEHIDTENTFVLWHDVRNGLGLNKEIVRAIHDAIGEKFEGFYTFDYSMCGLYVPPKYRNDFKMISVDDEIGRYKIQLECIKDR